MKFSIKDFPQETGDLVTFTEEILNEKLHFLYSGSSNTKNRRRRAKKNLAQNPEDYFLMNLSWKDRINTIKNKISKKHWVIIQSKKRVKGINFD